MGGGVYKSYRSHCHHHICQCRHEHTISYLTRSRRLFASLGKCAKHCHRHRCQSHHEAGIELLEDGSLNGDGGIGIEIANHESHYRQHYDGTRECLARCGLALCKAECGIHYHYEQHKVPNVEHHARESAIDLSGSILLGEECECATALLECHPEEDNHGKHQAKCHDAFFGFLWRQFFLSFAADRLLGVAVIVGMLIGIAEHIIHNNREHQREASHGKCSVIRFSLSPAEMLLSISHSPQSCRSGKERANVDGHIENAESRVAIGSIARVVVKIAGKHLQIALKEARTQAHKAESATHSHKSRHIATQRQSQEQIAQKHHYDAISHHLAIAETVGKHTAE